MKYSVVSTLYLSEPYIEQFLERVMAVVSPVDPDFEIILVNDGSPDNSLERAREAQQRYPNLRVVDLSRNFGHHKAMMTGLEYAHGERILLIDSDLEEPPECFSDFCEVMEQHNCDVVFGVQKKRRGGLLERLSGWIFYRLFRILTGIDQPDNVITARLMSARYVKALLQHRETNIIIGGLWVLTGFSQVPHLVEKLATSQTTYSLRSKFAYFVRSVTSFSSTPLVFSFYSGMIVLLTASVFFIYLLLRYFFGGVGTDGYTSTILSIWFFSGLIIFFISIQGIYIARIFAEVKNRPYTIVREVFEKED